MLNMGVHSCNRFISLCLWYIVFYLVFFDTSLLTHFLLPKWFETFQTSTEVVLNKTQSFLLKDYNIPPLNPSNNTHCFRTVWLSKPINCFLFNFPVGRLAGLSLGTELYLGAPNTKQRLLCPFSCLCLWPSSPNSPLPQWLFKFHSFFQI